MLPPEAQDFFSFEGRGCEFGGCESFLLCIGSWVAFCVMTRFCFGLVCKVVVKVQKQLYSFHLHGRAT